MRPKLTDVADKAGCSPTTVSRVINNYGYISEKTRKKVFKAMKELNYQPNSLARSLHGKGTKLIGAIFPSIMNPFFAELVAKLEEKLSLDGYKVIICNSANDPAMELQYLQMLEANQVDGIITGTHNLDIKDYNQYGLPIVSFDRNLGDSVPVVSSDHYQGGVMATKTLIEAGCRHICFVGTTYETGNPTDLRLKGYKDAIREANMQTHMKLINFETSPTLQAMELRDLLTSNQSLDGFFCSNDLTALTLINQAEQLGIAIPDKIKVVGFDGTQLIQQYMPKLTTVAQPIVELAELIINLLKQRINNPNQELTKNDYILPVKLLKNQTA